jgi:5-methylcytosine-specific restriction endonuclease McrA
MVVISRKAAKAAGLTHYFTGKPCKRGGHIDQRWVSSFMCVTCGREKALEHFRRLTGEKREARREYERRRWQDPEFRQRQRHHKQRPEEVEKQRLRNREWKKVNRARCTERENKRQAMLRAVFVEAVDPRVVFDRAKGICGICQREVDVTSRWEVDHIVPIAEGGVHAYANVQLAHGRCNRAKGAKVAS